MFSEEQKQAMANDPPAVDAEIVDDDEETGKDLAIVQPGALEALTRAELGSLIAAAHERPRERELAKIRKRIQSLSCAKGTAELCIYTLRRKDRQSGEYKSIEGPSVRFAEICVHCFGNMRAYSRVIANDGKKVTSQGVAIDLETNVAIGVEVSRRITDRNGRTFSDDMQIVTSNAANAISYRNAVFKVIPQALWGPAYEATRKVAAGSATSIEAKRDEMFRRFQPLGAGKREILQLLGKQSVESIDLDDLVTLVGLMNAIGEGEITAKEAFAAAPADDPMAGKPVSERVQARIDARKAQK